MVVVAATRSGREVRCHTRASTGILDRLGRSQMSVGTSAARLPRQAMSTSPSPERGRRTVSMATRLRLPGWASALPRPCDISAPMCPAACCSLAMGSSKAPHSIAAVSDTRSASSFGTLGTACRSDHIAGSSCRQQWRSLSPTATSRAASRRVDPVATHELIAVESAPLEMPSRPRSAPRVRSERANSLNAKTSSFTQDMRRERRAPKLSADLQHETSAVHRYDAPSSSSDTRAARCSDHRTSSSSDTRAARCSDHRRALSIKVADPPLAAVSAVSSTAPVTNGHARRPDLPPPSRSVPSGTSTCSLSRSCQAALGTGRGGIERGSSHVRTLSPFQCTQVDQQRYLCPEDREELPLPSESLSLLSASAQLSEPLARQNAWRLPLPSESFLLSASAQLSEPLARQNAWRSHGSASTWQACPTITTPPQIAKPWPASGSDAHLAALIDTQPRPRSLEPELREIDKRMSKPVAVSIATQTPARDAVEPGFVTPHLHPCRSEQATQDSRSECLSFRELSEAASALRRAVLGHSERSSDECADGSSSIAQTVSARSSANHCSENGKSSLGKSTFVKAGVLSSDTTACSRSCLQSAEAEAIYGDKAESTDVHENSGPQLERLEKENAELRAELEIAAKKLAEMEEQKERFYDEDIYDIMNKMCCGPSNAVEAPHSAPRSTTSQLLAQSDCHDSKGDLIELGPYVNFDIGSPVSPRALSLPSQATPLEGRSVIRGSCELNGQAMQSLTQANMDLEAATHDLAALLAMGSSSDGCCFRH